MEELFDISLLEIILGSALALVFLYQLYFYCRYMAGIQRRVRHQLKKRFRWAEKSAENDAEGEQQEMNKPAQPGVSVVVCAHNEAHNLQAYLQALVSQKYPEFEVIVVNDSSEDDTQLILSRYAQRFPNLRLTFVPNHAWVRSSKKLALTLAAKAAKYDYLLLTDADCRPESPYWIAEMMKGFVKPETEVVLGYGAYFEMPQRLNKLIRFDTIFNAMQYLGAAMSRHPYMGVGRNLAYKKSTFFGNNGFAGLLGERAGDDDLFVNKVATHKNTEVVVTPNSFTWSVPKTTFREWRMQKYRHLSVAPVYRLGTKLFLGFEPLTRGLFYGLVIAIAVLACLGYITNPLIWGGAVLLFVARLIWQISMISHTAHLLGTKGFGLEVLLYDIFLPLNNLVMLIHHRTHHYQEILW